MIGHTITLCVDGQRLPVAMEGDYKALDAAYRKASPQPGQPLLVSLDGLITPRPSMEEGRPAQTALVVERFISVWPHETCGHGLVASPLRGISWKLVRQGDNPVAVATRQREAHRIFTAEALRVSGEGAVRGGRAKVGTPRQTSGRLSAAAGDSTCQLAKH